MKRHLEVLTVALLSSSMLGCNILGDDESDDTPVAFENDAATLEKSYVPALFYSNLTAASAGLTADAENTLSRTATLWTNYKSAYGSYLDWSAYFGSVDANISTASDYYAGIVTYPADLTPAHLELEAIRDTWSTMRTSNGISYFFDNVTAAHHAMEPVGSAAATYAAIAAPSQTDLLALQTALMASVPTFQSNWDALTTRYGDGSGVNTLYDLSVDKSAALAANLSNADPAAPGMTQMLAKLSTAMGSCDTTTYDPASYDPAGTAPCDSMIFVSSKIKPKFVQVFLTFGDFISPFMSDIIASNKAMIPALYCTGNPPDATATCGDLAGTLAYLNNFAAKMQAFGAHLPVSPSMNLPGALGWGPSMMTAQMKLEEAIATLSVSPDLATAKANGAHLAMEEVRDAMHYICATYENHVTLMTRSNEFHTEFEKILAVALDPATGMPKPTLTATEVATIDGYMATLQTAFDNMRVQAELEDTAWGLFDGALTSTLDAQAVNIAELVTALTAYDTTTNENSGTIALLSLELKKKYVPFFKLMGAF